MRSLERRLADMERQQRAELFPMMASEQRTALIDEMLAAHGWTYDGLIAYYGGLDGAIKALERT